MSEKRMCVMVLVVDVLAFGNNLMLSRIFLARMRGEETCFGLVG